MNFYNPYYSFPYGLGSTTSGGLFSRLLGGLRGMNWGNMLTNVQKTLNIVNQAVPVIKQVNPMISNAKTMFKVMKEFNNSEKSNPTTTPPPNNEKTVSPTNSTVEKTPDLNESNIRSSNGPTFFL